MFGSVHDVIKPYITKRRSFGASLHIFSYLKKYHNTELVYDPSDPVVDENDFERRDWASSEFGHVEGKEEFPANMPEPRGHGFIMRAKMDADHASDTVSRQSRTGLLIYLNCALVYNRSLPLWTLLAVLWQMCHVWITYGTVRSSTITMR